MNLLEVIRSAIGALRSNVLRTSLTMLGIIIGIASVILIISLAQGATASITSQVSALGSNLIIVIPGVEQRGPAQGINTVTTLSYEDAQAIKKMPQVTTVSAIVSKRLQVIANGQNVNVTIQGVSEGYASVQSLEISSGEFISEDDDTSLSRVAVIGPQVVTDLFGEGADPIGEIVTVDSRPFRVIGVTKAKGSSGFSNPDDIIYIPVTTGMKILFGQNFVSSIMFNAKQAQEVDQTMEDVKTLLLDRHKITDPTLADFTVRSSKDALSTLNTITGLLTAMLAGIGAISLLVGGIGIMNIMLVTVTERTKEIGLLKAIGAKRSDILIQFLIESLVLTLTGGVAGIILGISLSYVISTLLLNIPFVLQATAVLLAVGVSTMVGVVFGIYPAQRAARLNPIDALRYE